jgi:hypothetical protein
MNTEWRRTDIATGQGPGIGHYGRHASGGTVPRVSWKLGGTAESRADQIVRRAHRVFGDRGFLNNNMWTVEPCFNRLRREPMPSPVADRCGCARVS